jgi:AraC family transcriptional regulator
MVARPPIPLRVKEHARVDAAPPGVRWDRLSDHLTLGRVDIVTDRDVVLPTRAGPHLSLAFMLDGDGHCLLGDKVLCPFAGGYAYLSWAWEQFEAEDYIPADTRYRVVVLRFAPERRQLLKKLENTFFPGKAVFRHRHRAAWVARSPLTPELEQYADHLFAAQPADDPLAALRLECLALSALHRFVVELALPDPITALPASKVRLSGRLRRQLLCAHRYIEEHATEAISVDDVRQTAGLGERALKEGFRALFGSSPYAYLMRCRLDKAANLLQTTDLAVGDVATRCGFTHGSHLARHFRRNFATSPMAFREQGQKAGTELP